MYNHFLFESQFINYCSEEYNGDLKDIKKPNFYQIDRQEKEVLVCYIHNLKLLHAYTWIAEGYGSTCSTIYQYTIKAISTCECDNTKVIIQANLRDSQVKKLQGEFLKLLYLFL